MSDVGHGTPTPSALATTPPVVSRDPRPRRRVPEHWRPERGDVAVLLAAGFAVLVAWRAGVAAPADAVQRWVRDHQQTHALFRFGFNPLSRTLKWAIEGLAHHLAGLPWYAVPSLAGLIVWSRGRRVRDAVLVAGCALLPALFGLWEPTMSTLALMAVSVLVALLLGVPLGVLTALSPRWDRSVRPLLDAMQTVPATVYLIPATLFFGIGAVPAAVATVVFALPPAVRLTALGIRGVPEASVEAGRMFGATRGQLLRGVQLPQAMPQIATGVNQTIMMALGIVVVAALVGAGGLGQEVLQTLQIRAPGRGMVVGAAIVALATVLDRVSASFMHAGRAAATRRRRGTLTAVLWLALLAAVLVGSTAGWRRVPWSWGTAFADPFDTAILWVRDHGRGVIRPFNDFVIRDVLVRSRRFLADTVPAPVLVAATAVLGLALRGWRLAIGITCGLVVIALTGMWRVSIETLVQVLTATMVSVLVAVPIGIFVGRRRRVEALLAPVLDALQTIPSLIYTIPFVMIFSVSVVPGGIIASSLYAIPAGIRLVALGIREVPEAPLEAATSFGATPRQLLRGVRLPLALPSILLALNQVIMLVLSMVVIAGMTGSGALGYRAVEALTRSNIGLGAAVGLAIVIMAMILDRLTQALAASTAPGRPNPTR